MAGRQEGVVARSQLQELGFSVRRIERAVERGLLHGLYEGVWTVGHTNVTPLGRMIAALLSCGPASFLSHRTAAALYGLRPMNTRAIEVTVITTCAPKRDGLLVHRTAQRPHHDELRTRPPHLRLSSPPRMLVECAAHEKPDELDRLITEAARRSLIDPAAVEATLQRHARRPGIARLRVAIDRYRPQPDRKSELERAFDRWLTTHPEIPEPQRNVHIGGWEIDCWWPQHRVALELDGRPYHVTVRDMDRDRLKDVKLQRLGIRPMRVTDARFARDAAGVHADLTALLELG